MGEPKAKPRIRAGPERRPPKHAIGPATSADGLDAHIERTARQIAVYLGFAAGLVVSINLHLQQGWLASVGIAYASVWVVPAVARVRSIRGIPS